MLFRLPIPINLLKTLSMVMHRRISHTIYYVQTFIPGEIINLTEWAHFLVTIFLQRGKIISRRGKKVGRISTGLIWSLLYKLPI